MSARGWLGLALATIASFFVAGIATTLLLVAFGQSLLGWHDNIGPEVSWGIIVGSIFALAVVSWLHTRWSSGSGSARP